MHSVDGNVAWYDPNTTTAWTGFVGVMHMTIQRGHYRDDDEGRIQTPELTSHLLLPHAAINTHTVGRTHVETAKTI